MANSLESSYDENLNLWKGYKFSYPYENNVFLGEKIIESLKSNENRLLQISHDENRELFAREFLTSIIRVAQNLTKIGIKSNDVIGIVCLNSISTSIIINASILIGAPVNPLDPLFTVDDICHMFKQTRPKLIVCDSDVYLTVKNSLINLQSDVKIFIIGEKIADAKSFEELSNPTGIEDEFIPPKFEESTFDKILAIICSSGTTGLSKGVCISHATAILRYIAYYQNEPKSITLTFGTAYWILGFYPHVSIGLAHSEVRIITKQRFNVKAFIEIIEKYNVSKVMLPPTLLIELLQYDKIWKHSSLKTLVCSGSVVTPSLRKLFVEKFPDVKLCISYGMTEYGVVRPIGNHNETSVGKTLVGNVEVKIVNDEEKRLGVGEIGEIRVRNQIKFLGYYGNPKETEEALDDEGFFKSGDIGYFDKSRQLYIIDRKKDILKYKGHQFNPSEIESVIQLIEGVKAVSVVGVLDSTMTDVPTAVIVKQKEYENILTEENIKKFIETKLSINKQIHDGVYFVDEIPMTASGKVQRKKVMENILGNKKNSSKKRLKGV